MFATCLFCDHTLGANRVLSTMPVGREVVFHAGTMRVWVVCPGCRRWNKADGLDLQMIAEFERAHAASPVRHTVGRIGTARIGDGRRGELQLIRIDADATWGEFAGWRFGRVLRQRHTRWLTVQAVGVVVMALVFFRNRLPFNPVWILQPISFATPFLAYWMVWRRALRLRLGGRAVALRVRTLLKAELKATPGAATRLVLPRWRGPISLEGEEMARALAITLPAIDARGGSAQQVDEAVQLIVDCGGPEALTALSGWPEELVRRGPARRWSRRPLLRYPVVTRLALEMAANEARERQSGEDEAERRAGELERAEEEAGIGDGL